MSLNHGDSPSRFAFWLPSLTVIVALVGLLLSLAGPTVAGTKGDETAPHELLFSLDLAEVGYSDTGDEQLPWGPIAIAADNGLLWIADGARTRVLGYTYSGERVRTIDLSADVVGIGDLEVRGDRLFVLDIAAVHPVVVTVDGTTGRTLSEHRVPGHAQLAAGLSGIWIDEDGAIHAEMEGGVRLVPISAVGSGTSYASAAGDIRIQPTEVELGKSASVDINGTVTSFSIDHYPGTVRLVGTTPTSAVFLVDEVSQHPNGQVVVDSTVRRLDQHGRLQGLARLPLADFVVSVPEPVTLTPEGEVVALVPREHSIDVVLLSEVGTLKPLLPPAWQPSEPAAQASTESCVYRSTMRTTDTGYRTNSKYLSLTNVDGACTHRSKPRYLTGAGTYSSVSYRWGGFDTVANFNANMSPSTGKAGDYTSGTEATCAFGVDCSGFVSRVWQLGYHCTTSCLDNSSVSDPVSVASLLEYDIFDKAGSHVVLFRYYSGSSGYYVSESTTSSNYDRVIYRYRSTSDLNGYSTYRSDDVC